MVEATTIIYLLSVLATGIALGTLIHYYAPEASLRRGPFGTGISITLVGLLATAPPLLLELHIVGWMIVMPEILLTIMLWAVFITSTVVTLHICDIIHKRRYGGPGGHNDGGK